MQEHLSIGISGSSCHYWVYFMNLHVMRTRTHTHTRARMIWTKWHQSCRPNGPAGTCKVRLATRANSKLFFSLSLPPSLSLALFGTIGGRDVRFGTCVGTSARAEQRSLGIGGVKVRRRVTWRLSHGKSTLALSVCRVTERNASAECVCACVLSRPWPALHVRCNARTQPRSSSCPNWLCSVLLVLSTPHHAPTPVPRPPKLGAGPAARKLRARANNFRLETDIPLKGKNRKKYKKRKDAYLNFTSSLSLPTC